MNIPADVFEKAKGAAVDAIKTELAPYAPAVVVDLVVSLVERAIAKSIAEAVESVTLTGGFAPVVDHRGEKTP